MTWLGIQTVAQLSVERVLNSLPEGLLIALFAWLLLRLIGRQNSGTRFAVWFVALMAVAGLSFFGGFRLSADHPLLAVNRVSPQIIVPAFWAVIIFAAWALAASLALIRVMVGLQQVCVIRKSCAEIDLSQLNPAIKEIFQSHSAGRPARLAVSDRVKVPAAIGFWKPIIVLPAWALRELAPHDLQPIFIHELTHLSRHDDWTNLLQKIVHAIFFFHPAVWWIDARLSLEREMACDDAVLANTGNPRAYANCLIDLLEKSCARRGWTMAQPAVQRAGALSLRIAQILDAERPATTRLWKPALGLTAVFSLACFAVSYCAPRLVGFAPLTPGSAAHIEKSHPAFHADDAAIPGMRATVIPASFHLPAPATRQKLPATSRKIAKQPAPLHTASPKLTSRREQQASASQMVLAKAKSTAPAARMLVLVETTEIDYGGNLQTNAAAWKTQVWHIVLITPALDAAQVEGMQSLI